MIYGNRSALARSLSGYRCSRLFRLMILPFNTSFSMPRELLNSALILAILITACSQEQGEDSSERLAKPPLGSKPEALDTASTALGSEPKSMPKMASDDRFRSMRFLDQRGMKGLGPNSQLERKMSVSKGLQRASEQEVRKNREAEAKLRAQQLAEARQNIHSKDPDVRLEALSGLDLDDPKDLALLEQALLSDASAEVREEAAVQLSVVDAKIALPALLDALADSEAEVTLAAIDSLSAIDTDDQAKIIEAVKHLAETHPDEAVREAAESALSTLQ